MLKSCNLFQPVVRRNETCTATADTQFEITSHQKQIDEKESTEKDSDEPAQGEGEQLKVCLT
jgi:hypothetical protein